MLNRIKGVKAKRRLEYQEGSYDLDLNLPMNIQCKTGVMPPRIEVILNSMPPSKTNWSVAISKRDRNKIIVGMYIDDWIDLISEWKERGEL